jgi:catechol 2,3-dioxygenase
MKEPIFDIAQLAHVEMLTPKPEESLKFFTEYLGMEVTQREGQSVYLRAYQDTYHHTLKLTESKQAGLGHIAWRTTSPQALDRRVKVLEASGYGQMWIEGDHGHGQAYRFTDPDGHQMELLWDVDYYKAPAEMQTKLINQPQKRPLRGVPVTRLDHVNLMVQDVTPNRLFMEENLGFRTRENIVLNDGTEVGAWTSVSPLVHEVAFMKDQSGAKGRLHHICYCLQTRQHLMDAAEIFTDYGIKIEAGPSKHGISQAFFMYVFEPGGNRIELFSDGYLILDPSHKTVTWSEDDLEKGIIWWGGSLPSEYFLYGTPIVNSSNV